jgi:transposase-like protein
MYTESTAMGRRIAAAHRKVSAREFVKAWQESSSVAEVARKVGSNSNACRVRAFRYRQNGVELKHFPFVEIPLIDWEELAEYADELVASE